MLVKILHQAQHLDELAASGVAHPRLHQPAQPVNAVGELPVVERRGLIERVALVFQQRQIVQRIIDELRRAVAAHVRCDDLAVTGDVHPVHISLRQHLLMAMARGNGVVVVAIPNQRQRRDAGGDLMTGVVGRRRQRQERRYIAFHALTDHCCMTTQNRLTPFAASVEETRIERIKAVGDRQGRHEVAPDKSDQPFHLPFVVPLAGPSKAILEEIVALEFGEHVRAQPLAALHDLRHGEPRVVVEDRLRHAAEKRERRYMAIAEGLRRLRRIGFDEATIRVRQIHAKIEEPDLLAADVAVRLAKIRLRVARAMV